MLVLYETALGYCLFKVSDAAKLESVDLWQEFRSPEKANKLCVYLPRDAGTVLILGYILSFYFHRLKLKGLHRFTSTATAVEDITALQSGKIGKGLKKFLTDEVIGKGKGKESLLVVDPHLGASEFFFLKTRFVLLDSQLALSRRNSTSPLTRRPNPKMIYGGVFVVKLLRYSTVWTRKIWRR